jgi:hypothetical protein
MKIIKYLLGIVIIILGFGLMKLNILLGSMILFAMLSIALNPPSINKIIRQSEDQAKLKEHIINSIQFITMHLFVIGSIIVFQLVNKKTNTEIDISLGVLFIAISIAIIYKKRKISDVSN